MQVNVRDLRNRTSDVVAAVRAGETVTLSVRGEPLADIVPTAAAVGGCRALG